MKPNQAAWESFLETGRIDDYLDYCKARKKEMCASMSGGNSGYEPDNQRDSSEKRQN